ncbi:bifunctional hydroxymethylpyrimidine kinase/phosphomethylpyrimidine kinase [Pantoea sp. B9002]|uniref:PfkB family carbohydrate kinase n=1 Tax=Pantoea sp. B9002 TaxID=2726979 RepID=UPI0015A12479|nr:PfkB family carbohydrate kinase [Pantoea sp. B9002]NWA63714.1 bifunctional hydroxymethylpyrimidine kinase/phosphomethylpyrimidine kinase [Pantoea sp. B9002]
MNKIIVAGSLHYDIMLAAHHRPEKGETVMGSGCSYKFGGKGGNQAVAAARAGAPVSFIGAVGDDAQGTFLLDALRDAGVDTQAVTILTGVPSGMSVAISDAEGDYGAVVVSNANLHIDAAATNDALWRDAGLLVLQNEVPPGVNLQLAQQAKQRGIAVCINAAPARHIEPELAACVQLLIVNAVEARDMCQIAVTDLASACEAAQVLAQRFPQVIVTAGEHGLAFCETGGTASYIAAIPVKLVSTHGAGDCFVGVLSQSLLAGLSLVDAAEKANHAAAEHVSRPLSA